MITKYIVFIYCMLVITSWVMLSISYSGFLPRNFQFAYAIKVSGLRYTSKLFRVEKCSIYSNFSIIRYNYMCSNEYMLLCVTFVQWGYLATNSNIPILYRNIEICSFFFRTTVIPFLLWYCRLANYFDIFYRCRYHHSVLIYFDKC